MKASVGICQDLVMIGVCYDTNHLVSQTGPFRIVIWPTKRVVMNPFPPFQNVECNGLGPLIK